MARVALADVSLNRCCLWFNLFWDVVDLLPSGTRNVDVIAIASWALFRGDMANKSVRYPRTIAPPMPFWRTALPRSARFHIRLQMWICRRWSIGVFVLAKLFFKSFFLFSQFINFFLKLKVLFDNLILRKHLEHHGSSSTTFTLFPIHSTGT